MSETMDLTEHVTRMGPVEPGVVPPYARGAGNGNGMQAVVAPAAPVPPPEEVTLTEELKKPSFRALFDSDLDPVRVYFDVEGAPEEAWIDLKPMGMDALNEHEQRFAAYQANSDGTMIAAPGADLAADMKHLIASTLVGWSLWQRPLLRDGRRGEWQNIVPPADPQQRKRAIEKFSMAREFGNWLAMECLRVNGRTPEQGKN